MKPRPPPDPQPQGQTLPEQGDTTAYERVPRSPHER
jgi:hypothetical protein